MAIKASVIISGYNPSSGNIQTTANLFDSSTGTPVSNSIFVTIGSTGMNSLSDIVATISPLIVSGALGKGYTITTDDIIWEGSPSIDVLSLVKTPSAVTPSLNTAFQISATQNARVTYPIDISTSLSLSGGTQGTVTLQYADDSAFTTNVKTVASGTQSNTGTLTIGLGLTQIGTVILSGFIPAAKYVKIVTANTVGTPSFTARAGQQVLEN